MGTNVEELKKIHDLDLDDYGDDATIARIRADLVSCDDTIRSIAANPAFEGETQHAVTGALAQLQTEVRKWYTAVGAIKTVRTTARDSMRTAKPKYEELPSALTHEEETPLGTVTVPNTTSQEMDQSALKREQQAAEALSPMDTTLTASAQALREIDLSRPAFDPNRQVDQTPLEESPGYNPANHGGGTGMHNGGTGSATTSYSGGGVSGGVGMTGYGTGAAVPGATYGSATGAFGAAAAVSSGRILSTAHTSHPIAGRTAWQTTQVDRFTSNTDANAVGTTQRAAAHASGRYTVKNGRLVPLTFSEHTPGTGASNKAGVIAGTAGAAAAAAAAVAAARGLSSGSSTVFTPGLNAATASGSAAALGVSGNTGMAGTASGGAAAQGSGGTGTQGAAGRPVMGAPAAAARGATQSRKRRRPDGIYDIPLLEESVEHEHSGDPGVAGQAGSLETMTTPEWTRESDTW
ncbi:hypothetical protein [Actinomyces qiguomingii]|uniref:hypothetical protein n=1 Tax=Actinomyces qiguomingii TaxID=2057800 RepID=UPI000CA07DD7|nr:hypothetical protein [Actinomyces qiguomingii]